MVKSQGVDVESERYYTEQAKVLRMVKGPHPVRFGELQLTLDQDQKRGLATMPKTMLEALQLINEFKVKAPASMQKPGVCLLCTPFKAVYAASVLTKGAPKGKPDKKRSGKPEQPSKVPTKEASFGGKCFKCDQEGHRAKECPNAAAVKEIMDDRAQDRRNVLAMTSQSPGPETVQKSIYLIRKVQASRMERESIARAIPRRFPDKTAGIGTNVQDIILAVNRRINKGFNFDDNWIILDSGAQTSLFHNAKFLKGLVQKVHPTQIIGIPDEPINITHEGYFCDNLQVDWHPDVPINVISFSQAEDLRWGITYDNAAREFVVQIHAGQNVFFSKCDGLYISDMT
jgi:hypothetical protein